MTEEQYEFENDYLNNSVTSIAIVKSYAYVEEYNPSTGRTEEKYGARLLKEGYVDGFLAGFSHKLTGD